MTDPRWLGVILVAALAAGACAEQETAETGAEIGEPAETAADTPADTPDPDNPDLAVWNTDADARLEQEEFDGWLAEQDFYGEWNTDGAEGLTSAEFGAGLFDVLDANDDGQVSETEWQDAADSWTDGAPWSEWDTSGDGTVDESEVAAGLATSDRWDAWDQDGSGVLEESEFNQAVFGAWDTNDDGYVDETEWRTSFDLW